MSDQGWRGLRHQKAHFTRERESRYDERIHMPNFGMLCGSNSRFGTKKEGICCYSFRSLM